MQMTTEEILSVWTYNLLKSQRNLEAAVGRLGNRHLSKALLTILEEDYDGDESYFFNTDLNYHKLAIRLTEETTRILKSHNIEKEVPEIIPEILRITHVESFGYSS
jgi:hypothetical protein